MEQTSLQLNDVKVLITRSIGIKVTCDFTKLRLKIKNNLIELFGENNVYEVGTDEKTLLTKSRLKENISSTFTINTNNSLPIEFAQRKQKILLPKYVNDYFTILIDDRPVKLIFDDEEAFEQKASILCFLSIVRNRMLVISLWISLFESPDTKNKQDVKPLISRISKGTGYYLAFEKCVQICDPKRKYDRLLWTNKNKNNHKILIESLLESYLNTMLLLSAGKIEPRLKESRKTESINDEYQFSAIIANIEQPVPDGFGQRQALTSCASKADWHCEAAGLLPPIIGKPNTYHTEYLHDLLGIDLMDSKNGHYFITHRLILSLNLPVIHLKKQLYFDKNIQTWTQLLCENASIQLRNVRELTLELEAEIADAKKGNFNLTSMLKRRCHEILDAEEYYNIAVSKNYVYWLHLQKLKEQSGINKLRDSLSKRMSSLLQIATLQEQRMFSTTARGVTLIIASFSIINILVSILIYSKIPLVELVYWTVGIAASTILIGSTILFIANR